MADVNLCLGKLGPGWDVVGNVYAREGQKRAQVISPGPYVLRTECPDRDVRLPPTVESPAAPLILPGHIHCS